jgi:antitoxin ParD1/3/4
MYDDKKYPIKSKINNLIRPDRIKQVQIDWINNKLESAENSGFTNDSREQILAESKELFGKRI